MSPTAALAASYMPVRWQSMDRLRNGDALTRTLAYDQSPQLRDSYAESKILAEQFAVCFAGRNGITVNHCQAWHRLWAGQATSGGPVGIHAGEEQLRIRRSAIITFR